MKTFILFLIFFSCFVVEVLSQNMKKISSDIYKMQLKEFKLLEGTYEFNNVVIAKEDRNKSKWYNYLRISFSSDTVYVNQSVDSQGYSYLIAWSSQDTIYLSHFFNREFELVKKELIPKELCKLISKWDKEEFLKCDKIGKTNPVVFPTLMNYTTRIVFKQEKYFLDCVKFLDCF